MNTNERELILKEETYAIVGAAMEVSNERGAGLLEAEALGNHSRPFAVENPGDRESATHRQSGEL
jgi:hypothetical protein